MHRPLSEATYPGTSFPAPATRRPAWREFTPVVLLGSALGIIVLLAIAFFLRDLGRFNDFRVEAWPAYRALSHGHLLAFVRQGPSYEGSLVLRAPFALAAQALGGGWRATYFATAVPCMIAPVVLGAWLSNHSAPAMNAGIASRVSPLVLCAFSPAVLVGLGDGHPEEVLGAALCVAAVVAALRGAANPAGLLLGLALVNKSWAIVAVPVVLAALPRGRWGALSVTAVTAAAVLAPIWFVRLDASGVSGGAAAFGTQTGSIFLYPQLLWWFGRTSWVVREAHVLLVAVCLLSGGLWWLTVGRRQTDLTKRRAQVLLLLCLVMLLRAALDPWDNFYYHLPFLFALMALEARRPPKLTLLYTVVLVIVVPLDTLGGSPSFQAAMYALVAIPSIGLFAAGAFGGAEAWRKLRESRMPAVPQTAGRSVS